MVLRRSAVLLGVATVALAGCGSHPLAHGRVHITPARSYVDRPVTLVASGLPAGQTVDVSATWRDHSGNPWRSNEPLRVSSSGRVVLRGLRGMRFLWDMRPASPRVPRGADFLLSAPGWKRVTVTIRSAGRVAAHTSFLRSEAPADIRARKLTVRRDGMFGFYFSRPRLRGRHPAVLYFGGSEGGLHFDSPGLLAARGYPTLSLAYFRGPGLPRRLMRIPLEYFQRALRWLAHQLHVDPRRVVVWGGSRGGEAALLIGATFPKLVHGVIALVPSDQVNAGPDGLDPAWTYRGRAVAPFHFIPVLRIRGPVLAAGAQDDGVWSSQLAVHQLHQDFADGHFRFPYRTIVFPHAGHSIGEAMPYWPVPDPRAWGGTRAGTAAAEARLWPDILRFLRRLPRWHLR